MSNFSLILILFGKALIGFLNLKNYQVEKDAYLYLAISAPILFFNFFNLLYTRILGSFGNNKLAFKINAIGVIINIILLEDINGYIKIFLNDSLYLH